MAEALFNTLGSDFFEAYSAGSHPTGKVNPFALEQISQLHLPCQPRSKSWDEFMAEDAPTLDIVVTVCGNTAQEICPHFAGQFKHVHWGLPDPAAVEGSDDQKRRAFTDCYEIFARRISQLISELSACEVNDYNVVKVMNQIALDNPLTKGEKHHALS